MTAPTQPAPEARATPEMIAAAWNAFRAGRPGHILTPGSGFVEAINAALAVDPLRTRDVDHAAEVARLTEIIRSSWRALESFGFPPEAAGWPFVEPDIGGAITSALDCLARQRDDLIARAEDAEVLAADLKARIGVLEAALRPLVLGSATLETILWGKMADKLGDFRRARAALAAEKEAER